MENKLSRVIKSVRKIIALKTEVRSVGEAAAAGVMAKGNEMKWRETINSPEK